MFNFFRKKTKELRADKNTLDRIEHHLSMMGYVFTPYGLGVALLEFESGYNEVETASHIALTTMALDVREAKNDIRKLSSLYIHGMALIKVLSEYKDQGSIRQELYDNDTAAIYGIVYVDKSQSEWVDAVLRDPVASKQRLAKSRIMFGAEELDRNDPDD